MRNNLLPSGGLTQVCFVHEYIQLVFQDVSFSLSNKVRIENDGDVFLQGEPGFCDALVSLIGLRPIDVARAPLTFDFGMGVRIIVQNNDASVSGPEAWTAHFSSGEIFVEHN
jgi:hypothetical protein